MFYDQKKKETVCSMARHLIHKNFIQENDCKKLSEKLISRRYYFKENVQLSKIYDNYGQEVEFRFREDGKQLYAIIAENEENKKYFEMLGYKPLYDKAKTHETRSSPTSNAKAKV